MEKYNKYWLSEERRRCILGKKKKGTLKHLLKECTKLGRVNLTKQELLSETYHTKVIDWYRSLKMTRRNVQEGEKEKYEMEHGQISKKCK